MSITNAITACGYFMNDLVFDHNVMDEKFYAGEMVVKRFSGAEDRLRVTVPERLMPLIRDSRGKMVEVSGQIRTYNKLVEGDFRLIVTLFALDAELSQDDDTVNQVILEGTISKDPIFRKTPLGREVCDLMISVPRSYGKWDYIPCIAWGYNARIIGSSKVGDHIQLEGRMQSREYQKLTPAGDYVNRTAYEVSIFNMTMEGASA